MREHQIVISLKPDQLKEVQRLARAANAGSLSVFVRQSLLGALGIEPTQTINNAVDSTTLAPVVNELRRLHGELKSFAAESLSTFTPSLSTSSQSTPTLGQSVPASSTSTTSAGATINLDESEPDELEAAASRAFAISPRLGAINSPDISTPTRAQQPSTQPGTPMLSRDPLAELFSDEEMQALAAQDALAKKIDEQRFVDIDNVVNSDELVKEETNPSVEHEPGSQDKQKPSLPPVSGGPPPKRRKL